MNYISHSCFKPSMALRILNAIHRDRLEEAHEAVQRRLTFLRNLKDFAEDGKIAIIEDGMDCDCSQYTGKVHIVDATVQAVEAEYESIANWADGTFDLRLERPSVAATIEKTSRDLAMEAHEDGHDHVVYTH